MDLRIFQGFDHRWTRLPHRIGGIGAGLAEDRRQAWGTMGVGQDQDEARLHVASRVLTLPGARVRRLTLRLPLVDHRDGAVWVAAGSSAPEACEGVAILAGWQWMLGCDDAVPAVWAHRFGLRLVQLDGELRLRVDLAHGDSPDPLKRPTGRHYEHSFEAAVDVIEGVAAQRVDVAATPLDIHDAPGAAVVRGGVGLTGFEWRVEAGSPPHGRYFGRVACFVGEQGEVGPGVRALASGLPVQPAKVAGRLHGLRLAEGGGPLEWAHATAGAEAAYFATMKLPSTVA